MTLEMLFVLAGLLMIILGVWLMLDASDTVMLVGLERRRKPREGIDPGGEMAVGLAIALMGLVVGIGDRWRYETVTALLALGLTLWGGYRNWGYMAESLFHRGPARRRDVGERLGNPPRRGPSGLFKRVQEGRRKQVNRVSPEASSQDTMLELS